MKTYLHNLNDRERWMVIITAIVVFIYGYYLVLYAPLHNKVQQKTEELTEKTQTLDWLQKVRQQKHAGPKKKQIDNSQLLTLLATQLQKNDTLKFPYQLQQTGSGDIQLSFAKVPFNVFMSWLAAIDNKYTMKVKQFDVERTDRPGVCKLVVILSAPSP